MESTSRNFWTPYLNLGDHYSYLNEDYLVYEIYDNGDITLHTEDSKITIPRKDVLEYIIQKEKYGTFKRK